MIKQKAINVIQECKSEYWDALQNTGNDDIGRIVKHVSLNDLVKLFDLAVVPAINEARRLDRGGDSKHRDRKTLSQSMGEFINKSIKDHELNGGDA